MIERAEVGQFGGAKPESTPSPDAEAIKAVRRSFQRFSMLQQPTPEKENGQSRGGKSGGYGEENRREGGYVVSQ